jgi:carbon storage regulator
MLVLTRKIGEEIVIDGHIRVSVVEVASGRVKIGIVAPRSVSIDRAEVHEKKAEQPVAVEVPQLHNRIAEQLLGTDGPRVAAPDSLAPAQFENRLKKHVASRLPKKPR